LTYTKAAVTRNKSEKAILSILDTVSHSNNRALLHEFYDTTLDSLREAQNEVLLRALRTLPSSLYSRFVAFLMFFCTPLLSAQPTSLFAPQRLWFKTKLAASKLAYKSEDYAKALKVHHQYLSFLTSRAVVWSPRLRHTHSSPLLLSLFRRPRH
jgi:hypothetical protein